MQKIYFKVSFYNDLNRPKIHVGILIGSLPEKVEHLNADRLNSYRYFFQFFLPQEREVGISQLELTAKFEARLKLPVINLQISDAGRGMAFASIPNSICLCGQQANPVSNNMTT